MHLYKIGKQAKITMTFNYERKEFGNIKNILYVGDDSNYWAQIKKEYEKHFSHISCLFYIYRIEGDITHKDVFLKTLQLCPSVIYLDFTKRHSEMFQLSRLLAREGTFYGSSVVGFVNDVEEVEEAMKNGCNFVYVKCGEFFDTVYGPLRYCLPDRISAPNFAKGLLDEKREVFIPLRIGCIHPQKIHFEGNFTPLSNQEYEVETQIERHNLPSKVFTSLDNNLNQGNYYNFFQSFSLAYNYVNKPTLLKDVEKAKELNQKIEVSPQVINATIQEYNVEREQVRRNFSAWVQSKLEESREKKARILIIDPDYEILHQYEGDLSSTPYAFRMQSSVDYALVDFKTFKPSLIVFNLMNEPTIEESRKIIFEHRKKKGALNKYAKKNHYADESKDPLDQDESDELDIEIKDNEDEEELKVILAEKIINDQLNKLFNKIVACKDYNPSVLIFNCKMPTAEIIEKYGHSKLVTTSNKFDIDLIMKMAGIIDANIGKLKLQQLTNTLDRLRADNPIKYKGVRAEDIVDPNFFVPKSDKLSSARLKLEINVIAISESEIWFKSKHKIFFGIYEIDLPTKVRFSIAPDAETYQNFTADKDGDIYHGLIHSFDENGKKLLRQEVNRIFFSDLIAQREMESKEYQEVTKDALNKKMEELEKLKKMMELNEIKKKL